MSGEQTSTHGGSALLRVESLVRAYGAGPHRHVAIDGIDFEVRGGEFVTIVGPSGCGKTTLLKCVAGLLAPTEGKIFFEGQLVERVPDHMGFVFQQYSRSLFPWLNVAKNITFPLRGKIPEKEQQERVQESLRAVGLEDSPDRYPWQLSGGMQQRVAIARALAYRPDVLLMDEPFGSVDAYTRSQLEDLILAVRAHYDMTIVLVTHDIDESVYLGDRVLVLAPSPSYVVEDVDVPLSAERDQVSTRQDPRFTQTRAHIARLIFAGMGEDSGDSVARPPKD